MLQPTVPPVHEPVNRWHAGESGKLLLHAFTRIAPHLRLFVHSLDYRMILVPFPSDLLQIHGLELLPQLLQHLAPVLQLRHYNILLVRCFYFFVPAEEG